MDNINDIINSLSADDINMLKGVASSILGGEATANNANEKASATPFDLSGFDNIDFDMLMKAKNIFEKMNNVKSKNADLILALKPHLSPQTQDKADQALKMMRLFEILPYLRELF